MSLGFRRLAKVNVEGSSPFARSKIGQEKRSLGDEPPTGRFLFLPPSPVRSTVLDAPGRTTPNCRYPSIHRLPTAPRQTSSESGTTQAASTISTDGITGTLAAAAIEARMARISLCFPLRPGRTPRGNLFHLFGCGRRNTHFSGSLGISVRRHPKSSRSKVEPTTFGTLIIAIVIVSPHSRQPTAPS